MYLAFAHKADAEGKPNIARLFRAAAAAETVHAHAHLRAMGGVNDTVANLETAVAGEGHEFKDMYPPFVAEAAKEGHTQAESSFTFALAVEKIHHDLYTTALEAAQKGADLEAQNIYVCAVCGNTVYGEAPERCPICGVPASKFNEIQ